MPVFGQRIESQMKPNDHGFTLIEIVIVMVLISIVAATVFTRSITTDELNLISRAEKIQSHIRFAQSMAMKTNDVWGINCIGNKYWLFNKNFSLKVKLPGENSEEIDLDGSGLNIPNFPLFFDNFGRPYLVYNSPESNFPITSAVYAAPGSLTIRVESTEDTSIVRKLSITPETGLIVVTQ
jgi:prepilin-type N-terminal cleavage/methylation domain-containing protein